MPFGPGAAIFVINLSSRPKEFTLSEVEWEGSGLQNDVGTRLTETLRNT